MPTAQAIGNPTGKAGRRMVAAEPGKPRKLQEGPQEYLVTCDCGKEKKLTAGGKTWAHNCVAYDPDGEREARVVIVIDEEGHVRTASAPPDFIELSG